MFTLAEILGISHLELLSGFDRECYIYVRAVHTLIPFEQQVMFDQDG